MNSFLRRESIPDLKIYDRSDITVLRVTGAVVAQVWLLLVFLGGLLLIALVWFIRSGDRVPAEMAWMLFKAATFGLVGSFALHESAHAVVLKHIYSVAQVAIVRTALRTSIVSYGSLTARQVVLVAVAGPAACVAAGSALWISGLAPSLTWWYLAHGVFLLPFFGDGRNLYYGLRGRGADPAVSQ